MSNASELPQTPTTTAIGSLPHHNVDAALAFSFQLDIPFLPQIPIRNPWEFIIAQTLEGMPGLQVERDGTVMLDQDIWHVRSRSFRVFNDRLLNAFAAATKPEAFESFEPSSATSSCWQPFLWELAEHGTKIAKVQLAGPLTAQWALRLKDGTPLDQQPPETSNPIFRLVLARALAMTRRLSSSGVRPLIYLDEPGLYGFDASNPRHVLGLQELRLVIQALRKEGALVGLHCCSNTDWTAVLGLSLNVLSIDTGVSLQQLLAAGPALDRFIDSGGRLSLGVIPTSKALPLQSLDSRDLLGSLLDTFATHWKTKPERVKKVLYEALYTPACGLALHSTEGAELVLAALREFHGYVTSTLSARR